MFTSGIAAGADAASSNIAGTRREQISSKRSPAPRPSGVDISIWVKHLREASTLEKRRSAAIELSNINNPAALPHFAMAFYTESHEELCNVIEHYGKILYLNQLYWSMSQDGTIEAEIEKRKEQTPQNKTQQASSAKAEDEAQKRAEIANILAQAEAKKRARRKKRR